METALLIFFSFLSSSFSTDATVVALEEDVPRGRKWRVRRKFRLPAAVPTAAAATRAAAPGARLRSVVQTGDSIRSYGGTISLLPDLALARMVQPTFAIIQEMGKIM